METCSCTHHISFRRRTWCTTTAQRVTKRAATSEGGAQPRALQQPPQRLSGGVPKERRPQRLLWHPKPLFDGPALPSSHRCRQMGLFPGDEVACRYRNSSEGSSGVGEGAETTRTSSSPRSWIRWVFATTTCRTRRRAGMPPATQMCWKTQIDPTMATHRDPSRRKPPPPPRVHPRRRPSTTTTIAT